jgi:hypothetical protein
VGQENVSREAIGNSGPGFLFAGHEFREPEWIVQFWDSHDGGREKSDDVWRVTSSGNLSISSSAFWSIGGFDETVFVGWGGEDNDFGYRAYQFGCLVVPEPEALAWHLGWGTYSSDNITELRQQARLILAGRIPSDTLPSLGAIQPSVPDIWVKITADNMSLEEVVKLCSECLQSPTSTSLSLLVDSNSPLASSIRAILAGEPRVHIGSWETTPPTWRLARVRLETSSSFWTAGDVGAIAARVREGLIGEMRVIHRDESISVARLTRLIAQVDQGLIDETEAFAAYGGRWITEDGLLQPDFRISQLPDAQAAMAGDVD